MNARLIHNIINISIISIGKVFFLQGKTVRAVVIKTRSASAKGPKRTSAKKKMRSTSVPVERKENIYESGDCSPSQPTCSKVFTVPRSRPKSFISVRSKTRKEGTLKLKPNVGNEKSKSITNLKSASSLHCLAKQKIKANTSSKLQTIKEKQSKARSSESDDSGRIKLREICFIKSSEGKRMIAKYKTKSDRKGSEDNLIVAWDNGNHPQVYSHKTRGSDVQDLKPFGDDAGPSKNGPFRVHNFAKFTPVKPVKSAKPNKKRSKRPLRRLTSASDSSAKKDKLKKRKILKSQTT